MGRVSQKMTQFEKDVIDRLARIEEKLTRDYHTIHGNGKPGIIEKVENITSRVDRLEARQKEQSKQTGLIAGVTGFIINAAIAIYAAFKNHGG